MKVTVKVKVCWSQFSNRPVALKAVYKTSKSFFKKEIDILREYELTVREQIPFIEQLEELINSGDIEKVICDKVKKDIINGLMSQDEETREDERMERALSKVKGMKLTFEFNESKDETFKTERC